MLASRIAPPVEQCSNDVWGAGRCLQRLQSQIMQCDAVKQSAVGPISKNDITCALLWMIK